MLNKKSSGMTLIEILVALTIASIMMLGVFEVFVAQKNLFVSTDITASAQDNARVALDSIQRDLVHAGFGVDPSLAFPFVDINTGTPADFDRTDRPDELQFLARERFPLPGAGESGCPPMVTDAGRRFYWSITSAGAGAGITIHVCPGFELHRGTFLLAMCNDAGTYAYMRYMGPNLSSNGETNISISAGVLNVFYSVSDRTYPPTFGSNLDQGCYNDGYAQLHRINYYRYYIRRTEPYNPDAETPYLMLDRGVDLNGDNNFDENDHIPVAEGIEDLQVVFTLLNGNCAGNPTCTYSEVENMPNYSDITRPLFCDEPYPDPQDTGTCISGDTTARPRDLPGNTVAVRVSIVARTAIHEPISGSSAGGAPAGFPQIDVENHIIPAPKTVDRFKRLLFQITVPITNTLSRTSFPFL